MSATTVSLAVRELAELVHRRGDIHVRFERATTGAEGIATQKRVQASKPDSYQAEQPVGMEFTAGEQTIRLTGRIDGCDIAAGLVEEYKTTRADIDRVHAHNGHVHRAQLLLYGGLLALDQPDISSWQLDLCYCHPEQDAVVRRIGESMARESLIEFLNLSIAAWRTRLLELAAWRSARDDRLGSLQFPFERFRPNQRALAGRVYSALRKGENLLLEAATGTGKSLATLYPAYRALADTPLERIFFLTSRTTGQDAAQAAAALLAPAAEARTVTIIAREKSCLVEGMPCDPDGCEYARGYYDKLPRALAAGLQLGHTTPADISRVAEEHTVCPFELSLDMSRWCDLVVMDYNYVFDPVVRLQRFAETPDAAILLDEAHQLESRVRDMLSVQFPKWQLDNVLAEGSGLPDVLRKPAATLRRSFTRAAKIPHEIDAADTRKNDFDDQQIAFPKAFTERCSDFVQKIGEQGDEPLEADLAELFFTCVRWQKAQEWLNFENNAAAFYQRNSRTLKLVCLDPAEYIADKLANYGPNAQFSGTLSPLTLYRRLHGDADAELARVAPGDLSDRLGLFVVPDIPTWFRSRDASLPGLVQLVHSICNVRQGNYFVAFPSFTYLTQFANLYAQSYPDAKLLRQQPASAQQNREDFVAHFRSASEPTLGCVVLGGVFTESLDFADDALLGVIVVSVALPPPDTAREVLARHYSTEEEPDLGQVVAYRQPAMVRVIQAAGRVVRNETDRGVVCLVDSRFQQPQFAQLQPPHWQPRTVRAKALPNELQRFWASATE